MNAYVQMAVYLVLGAVLAVSAFLSFLHKDSLFSKHHAVYDGRTDILNGFILLGAAGTAVMFGIRMIWRTDWALKGLWICIAAALVPAAIEAVRIQRKDQ